MIKVAITGNIASGKSQVENILISLGFKVIDTDKINHDLLENNIEVKNKIIEMFGENVLTIEGNISREKLGRIVFSSPKKKQQLEEILHEKIFLKMEKFFEENRREKVIFVTVPLLFEAGWENNFDKIIFVTADKNLRLSRLIKRNGYNEEYAKIRINSQIEEDKKVEKADFVIYNNSDLKSLKNEVEKIIQEGISD